jgi:putative colanic acid biosynthesis glycosyltransferase
LQTKETNNLVADRPTVTVVTVVFNAEQYLEDTILSVSEQSYSDIKYLVIDGESTDNTLEIIKKYENLIDVWVSEKDRGIYDAMNKAAIMTGSGYLCFMNAGDVFYSPETVEKVISNIGESRPGVIYGDSQVCYADGFNRILLSASLDHLWRGMCFSHQSMFVDSELMKKNLFNIDNEISADYEFICRLFSSQTQFMQIGEIVATTSAGGVSDTKRLSSIKSTWRVSRFVWPGLKTDVYFVIMLSDALLRMLVRWGLPDSLVTRLRHIKYK